MICLVRKRLYAILNKITILNLIWFVFFLLVFPTTPAASEHDLVIESNIRYFLGQGGGELIIDVQGDLALEVRRDIYEDFLINPNITLNENHVINQFGEAMEDLLELNINPNRVFYGDMEPDEANVDYNDGNYKIVKIGGKARNVDINSIKGLIGTKIDDTSKFTISMDIKGDLYIDETVTLTDGYIILYALFGDDINSLSVKVKEKSTITTVGLSTYSDTKLNSGGEINHYRLVVGDHIEYTHEYELSGYENANSKKDTISFDSFNFVQNALLLALIIIIFTIVGVMLGKHFVKRNNVNKVKLLRILGGVFFIILTLIYFIGIDGLIIWLIAIMFFLVNIVVNYGVYEKGWGNLAQVTIRHEDFIRQPPRIDDGPWHERGIANAKVGNFHEAMNCFENALEAEPENATIWNDLGFVHRKLGNSRQALDCFSKALEYRPNYPTALENLQKAKLELESQTRRGL